MNIFESLYNGYEKSTIAPFEKYENFIKGIKLYCKQPKRNPKEEFLTQVFVNIMLQDDSFRKAFLEKLEIADGEWGFEAERFGSAEINGETTNGEMDVFGTSKPTKSLLIIENKLNSEIDLEQPKKYAEVFNVNAEKAGYSEYTKYVVVLTKFSGLITYWNSYEGGIKEKIVSALQNEIDEKIGKGKYICKHIYWHEVYTLLENNFSNTEMQQELLVFLKSQNLDQEWCQDIGSPDWRKRLIEAYNDFADKNSIDKLSKRGKLGPVGNNKICFIGSRVQGARSVEAAAQKDKNDELCCFLKLEIKDKSGKKEYIDLSDCCYDPIETIIENCSEAILEAYGKK